MQLDGKNAVVYGAVGSMGSAVSRAFAAAGARVFLAGRTAATLDALADEIRAAGGRAETAVVDATVKESVDAHAAAVVERAGSLDVSFNAVAYDALQDVGAAARICDISDRLLAEQAGRMLLCPGPIPVS
ncbi:Short-chain alcohol dehydrogenase of unknown specificity, partial [Cellulosimicrobium cellulans J1]